MKHFFSALLHSALGIALITLLQISNSNAQTKELTDYSAAIELATYASETGKNKAAMIYYTIAVDLDNSKYGGYFGRGCLKARLGDLAGALEDLNVAVKLAPFDRNVEVVSARGSVLVKRRYFQQAIKDFSYVLSREPYSADTYLRRGLCKIALEDFGSACIDLRKSTEYGNIDAFKYINEYCQ